MAPITPLEMAQNAAAAVRDYSEHLKHDPAGARIAYAGERGMAAGQMAGYMALVSIATDLHRLVELIEEMDGE
jgi:hypothetical protein